MGMESSCDLGLIEETKFVQFLYKLKFNIQKPR